MIFGMKKRKEDSKESAIHWHAVKSSFVEAVAYDNDSSELYITLSHGSYIYNDVPVHVFEELLLASSKGSYFNGNIKDVYVFSNR